jgi:hypothetical protein
VTVAVKCRTYQQLTQALAARRRQLGLRQLDLDEKSGLQPGYSGKVEVGIRKLGDLSMPMLCAALDIDILVAPRSEASPSERPGGSAGRVQHLDRQPNSENSHG